MRRRINAASVMVVTPSFSASNATALREAATASAATGLHLTLTAPFHPLTDFAPLRDGAFLSAGLVDEVLLYVAPVLLGERARPMFDGLAIDTMAQKLSMSIVESRYIGHDVRLTLRPDSP